MRKTSLLHARSLARGAIVLLGLLTIDADAQVRQSSNEDLLVKEWHSPVTVEMPISGLVTAPPGERWTIPDIPQFYCDDVTVDEITMTKSIAKKSSDVTLRVMTRLYVRAQEDDKAVSLEYSLVEGDRKEFLGRIEDIDGQAADTKTVWESFVLPKDVFERYFTVGRSPVLLLSVVVRTN